MEIYTRLRNEIKAKGIQHRWIAIQLGVSDATLSNMLNGKTKLPVKTFAKICEVTGIETQKIL